MKNYTVYHLHSDLGNGTMMDSATKYKQYIKLAKQNNMTAIAFSEHGNFFNWIMKKQDCDSQGIKYIHGCEFYMTTTLDEKIHEAFHIGLYAKNWEGVKELNKLSSNSFNKEDNHYYYRPRVSMQEIMNTSDNVIVTTGCLASILWNKRNEDICKTFLNWLSKNKHRCFLEIQYHSSKDQVEYNQLLYKWSKEYGIKLIAGTDTHSATEIEAELRSVLQKSKNIIFSNEDEFDLTFKTYDQLVEMFKKQNALPEDVYIEAIDNTNLFANLVEHFELDKSHKYPKISKNPEEELQHKIVEGLRKRKVNTWSKEKEDIYFARIREEFDVFKQLGMLDYVLLVNNITRFCKENNISVAPRGSCNGSLIFWVLGVTDIDSIKFNLPFFRFCNPSRVSLGDVDIDMAGDKRPLVKDFLYNYKGINGSAIITFQTYALRGAVRGIGRGLGIPLDEVELIAEDIDEMDEEDYETGEMKKTTTFHNKQKWEEEYPELLKLAYKSLGIIENVSVHACGFVATDRDIDEEIGTFRTDTSKWVVSQNNMKCIDSINFVKMDFLVVDNVQIVEDVCKLANIPLLENDKLDFEDMNVWNEMLKSGLGIFQFEKTGWTYLKQTLENFEKFKTQMSAITKLDVMTALNGIIRPVGASIREDFIKGVPYRSGMKEIDDFLGETLSYCIYQEQIMEWLSNFCNYSMAEADLVRRGIAKKGGTESLIPKIHKGFMEYCVSKYPIYSLEHLEEVCQKFIQVILDASNYGFSRNHSCPYTILGFKGAYLRHYYPLQYLTVQFNMHENDTEKTAKIVDFVVRHTDIQIQSIKFRKSKSEYNCDKLTNSIYKGIKSVKYCNSQIADDLYELGKNSYNNFIELLFDVEKHSSVNCRQMEILIKLNFFSEFGKSKKLLQVYNYFQLLANKKQLKKEVAKKHGIEQLAYTFARETEKTYMDLNSTALLIEIANNMPNESFTLQETVEFELEYFGYITTLMPSLSDEYVVITAIECKYKNPVVTLYHLHNGQIENIKVKKNTFDAYPLQKFDVIRIIRKFEDFRWKRNNDGSYKRLDEKEWFLSTWNKIKQ